MVRKRQHRNDRGSLLRLRFAEGNVDDQFVALGAKSLDFLTEGRFVNPERFGFLVTWCATYDQPGWYIDASRVREAQAALYPRTEAAEDFMSGNPRFVRLQPEGSFVLLQVSRRFRNHDEVRAFNRLSRVAINR